MENNFNLPENVAKLPKYTEEELKEKQLEMLRVSYYMYEQEKKNMKKRRKEAVDKFGQRIYSDDSIDSTMELIDNMQRDVIAQYVQAGGNMADLENYKPKNTTTKNRQKKVVESMTRMNTEEAVEEKNKKETFTTYKKEEERVLKQATTQTEVETKYDFEPSKTNFSGHIQFDNVPLPSKGECYKSKLDKIPVAYLTAYDENMIVSPNLYKDGSFIDVMLSNKIMNNKINPDDLLPGDRDAIILWLRATSYGTDFPVAAHDDVTGKQFETTIDLSKLNYKKFKLNGDEDGYFDFELPFSKRKVKFKFLTYGDLKTIDKMDVKDNKGLLKQKVESLVNNMNELFDFDEEMDTDIERGLKKGVETLESYAEELDKYKNKEFTRTVTNKLCASIMSIDGITDRNYITEQVMYMNVKDSSALRKYITENEPGINFNVTIEKPESLGGGSMSIFLTLDQYLFLNIV